MEMRRCLSLKLVWTHRKQLVSLSVSQMYASEALALMGENPSLCHVSATLHCTLGTCLLAHSARERGNEETLRKIRQRNEEENGRWDEPQGNLQNVPAEAGPAWPLEVPASNGTTELATADANPSVENMQSSESESGKGATLVDPEIKTELNPWEKRNLTEKEKDGPSETVKRLEQHGVNALEQAIAIGLREGRYDVAWDAAARLAAMYAREGFKASDAKCAEYVALAQGCKARAFLMGALETACARDDAQIVALRKFVGVKRKGEQFSAWPEPPFADFRAIGNGADDVNVTSAEAAVQAVSPCAWGFLEGLKNQSFEEATARLQSDAAALFLHLDEERGALYAVSVGPVPSEVPTGQSSEKGKGEESSGGKEKGTKRRTNKGKDKAAGVIMKDTPPTGISGDEGRESAKRERSIDIRRVDLGDRGRPLLDLVKDFEVWRVHAKRAVARAHVAAAEDRADADESGETATKPALGTANGSKAVKGKDSPVPGDSLQGASGASKVGKAPVGKGPRASSRAGRASKPSSRPPSRLQRTPLNAELEERWEVLIDRMGELFQPLKAAFDAAAGRIDANRRSDSRQSDRTTLEEPIENTAPVPALTPRQLILFLDPKIAPLPFEALPEFQSPHITSLSRDFSLAVFAHRVARAAAPKSSQTLPLDLRRFCYIVDPQNEDKPRAASLPTRVTPPLADAFSEISQSLAGSFNAKEWRGITGADHVPSDGEIQRLVATSSGMIFVGMGGFLAYASAAALAALDLGTCQLAVLAGMSVSDESLRRQVGRRFVFKVVPSSLNGSLAPKLC